MSGERPYISNFEKSTSRGGKFKLNFSMKLNFIFKILLILAVIFLIIDKFMNNFR